MRLMLTNDDGLDAPGIAAMYQIAVQRGELIVVAPDDVQSATSHAVTFHRPIAVTRRQPRIRADEFELDPINWQGSAVAGRPADCVKLALAALVDPEPDLVISGINAGANVGVNIIYSGTVAAAMEAAISGLPAVAVSVELADRNRIHWPTIAQRAAGALDIVMQGPLTPGVVININIPAADRVPQIKGHKVATMCLSKVVEQYDHHPHEESPAYAARDVFEFEDRTPGSDVAALYEGYVTITPLQICRTASDHLDRWDKHVTAKA